MKLFAGFGNAAKLLAFSHDHLDFQKVPANSYFASVAGDFLRNKLLEQKASFTFETVMSHYSKVEFFGTGTAGGLSDVFIFRRHG